MNANVVYGVHPVIEAMCAGAEIETIYLAVGLRGSTRREIEELANPRGVRILKTDRHELDKMAQGGAHQGVVAIARRPGTVSLEALAAMQQSPRTVLVCLDEIQDPRNLGALARSALAFGAAGMVVPSVRSAGITPAALKASAGALSRLPVARVKNLSRALVKLKESGFWVCGAVVEDGRAPWDFDPGEKVALVLGSEGTGLRRGIESRLDHRVRIPMTQPSESLNVSVAGALLLYEWLGRKKSD